MASAQAMSFGWSEPLLLTSIAMCVHVVKLEITWVFHDLVYKVGMCVNVKVGVGPPNCSSLEVANCTGTQ